MIDTRISRFFPYRTAFVNTTLKLPRNQEFEDDIYDIAEMQNLNIQRDNHVCFEVENTETKEHMFVMFTDGNILIGNSIREGRW